MSHNGSRSSSPARVPEWDLLELHQAHLLGVLVIITGIRGHNHWDQGLALISSVLPGTTSPCSRHQLTPPCPSRGLCHFQGQPNRLQLPLLGIAAPGNTPGSGSPSDRSNLSIPAPQSWRKPRQEHSCLIYIVNILSFKSAPMVFPLLLRVVSVRKWLLCSLQNKPQQQNSPGLGDTVGHGDVLGGQGTLLRASVSTPTVLPPAGTSPSSALCILQCRQQHQAMQGRGCTATFRSCGAEMQDPDPNPNPSRQRNEGQHWEPGKS